MAQTYQQLKYEDETMAEKVSVSEAINQLARTGKALSEDVDKIRGRVNLDHAAGEKLAGEVAAVTARVGTIERVLFTLLSIQRDNVRGLLNHENPEVASEAGAQLDLVIEGQRQLDPAYFEWLYGASAETGEQLPGRTLGVADSENPPPVR